MRLFRLWILWRPWFNGIQIFRMAKEMFPATPKLCLDIGPFQVWWFDKEKIHEA